MESTAVSHPGNWFSEENWGLFQSQMSCSIINLLFSNYLQKGGHYRPRNCRREAAIGILCMRAPGTARRRGQWNAMSPHWSGHVQPLVSAFGNSLSRGISLQASHVPLSASSPPKYGHRFLRFLSATRLRRSSWLLLYVCLLSDATPGSVPDHCTCCWKALYLGWPPVSSVSTSVNFPLPSSTDIHQWLCAWQAYNGSIDHCVLVLW